MTPSGSCRCRIPVSPLVCGLGWLLAASLVVAGLAGGSPWLHWVLEHGASDRTPLHGHARQGHSNWSDDYFAAFRDTPLAALHGHAHSPAHEHVHPDAREVASDAAAGHGDGTVPESSGHHSHHGLPALLTAGLVDLAGPVALLPGAILVCGVFRSLPVLVWTEVLPLDRNQAARPPPRWTGDW